MQLLTGRTITLLVFPSDTIVCITTVLEDVEGIAVCNQRLVCDGRSLSASYRALSDYIIEERATLLVVMRLRGGGFF